MALALFLLPPALQFLGALPGVCHLGLLAAHGSTTHASIPAARTPPQLTRELLERLWRMMFAFLKVTLSVQVAGIR